MVCSYGGRKGRGRTHGASHHPLYDCWRAMVRRCTRDLPYTQNWYGRGIGVCVEWRNDVWAFINWAENNGWQPGLEIDRRDNDGDYTPENCRFVSDKEQANNRRPRQLSEAGKRAIRDAVIASNKRRFASPKGRLQALKNLSRNCSGEE